MSSYGAGTTIMPAIPKRLPVSELLREMGEDPRRDWISVGDLLHALGERALGALLFIFAVPNILPTLPGTSSVLGAPLVFLAMQLTLGRRPWLPPFIAKRAMSREDFLGLVRRIGPWLEKAERLLRPRASSLTTPPLQYVLGFVCLLLSIVLVLPIPLGNILPGLAISLIALGVLENDGLCAALGLVAAVASGMIVSGVAYAAATAAGFLLKDLL